MKILSILLILTFGMMVVGCGDDKGDAPKVPDKKDVEGAAGDAADKVEDAADDAAGALEDATSGAADKAGELGVAVQEAMTCALDGCDKAVNPTLVSTVDGKPVGFCCGGCKDKAN